MITKEASELLGDYSIFRIPFLLTDPAPTYLVGTT